MSRLLQSSSLLFFKKQFETLKKKAHMNHYEHYLQIKPPKGFSIHISLEKRNSFILMRIQITQYPYCYHSESIIADTDCNRLIAEYAATHLYISIKLDLSCILSSHYYAYPFHPFVWRLVSLYTNDANEIDIKRIEYTIENNILFHNHCTNAIKKNVSQERFFEKDIATFFKNHNVFDLFIKNK
jgi:hypothetical protein